MAEQETLISEEVEWTVVENDDINGEEVETQEAPVFVAMQPGVDIPAGVEVHEVVISTEGSETVHEVVQQPEIPQRQELSTLLRDDNLLNRHMEAPKIRIKKRPLGQYAPDRRYETPTKPPSRGRPKGSKNITYKQPTPRPRAQVRSPSLRTPVHIKQESQTSSDESESESDDEDDLDGPPRKRPKPRDFAHRLQWRNKDMLDAMKTVQEKKYTIRGAAKKFSVPYSTLKDRVHGRVRHGSKPGVKTALSPEEEEELVAYVKDMEASGFQMKCMDVRDRAAEMLRLNPRSNGSKYKEGSPGHNWLAGFLKRHPGLEFKRSVNRNIVPSLSKQKQMVRRFFDIASSIYKKHKMTARADRIFSVSELRLHGMLEASILYAAAADGTTIPPFVIFRGRALKLTAARQAYKDAFFTCCGDGNVNEDSFLWWYRDHFMKHISHSTRPSVLYIGRSIQDITLQLVQHAKEERVHLIALPRGVHHLLQPLDNEINDNIRNMIVKRLQKWQNENPGQVYTQKLIAVILQKVWKKINPSDIVNKFTKNGLFPLNTYAINNDRIVAASHLLRESYSRDPPEPGSSPLAGLNLLSALSSHEYASIDMYNSGVTNQSFEQESDTSANNGDPRNRLEHGIELEETPIEENVVMEDNIIEEPVEIGEEIVEGSEEMKHILAAQHQEHVRKTKAKHRPNTDLLQRNTNVQSEISAARNNPEQITRAIHSILELEASQDHTGQHHAQEGQWQDVEEDTETITVKQEPIVSNHATLQRATFTGTVPSKPAVQTLRLVDGKLVNENGKEVDLSIMNAQNVSVQIKSKEEEEEEEGLGGNVIQDDLIQGDNQVVHVEGSENIVQVQASGDYVEVPQLVQGHDSAEEIGNLSQEQFQALISSGSIQAVDSSAGVMQTADGDEFVQVLDAASGELPQQILQSEEVQQPIYLDQSQLQHWLQQGGQILTTEEEEDPQETIQYIQLGDGSFQQVQLQ